MWANLFAFYLRSIYSLPLSIYLSISGSSINALVTIIPIWFIKDVVIDGDNDTILSP